MTDTTLPEIHANMTLEELLNIATANDVMVVNVLPAGPVEDSHATKLAVCEFIERALATRANREEAERQAEQLVDDTDDEDSPVAVLLSPAMSARLFDEQDDFAVGLLAADKESGIIEPEPDVLIAIETLSVYDTGSDPAARLVRLIVAQAQAKLAARVWVGSVKQQTRTDPYTKKKITMTWCAIAVLEDLDEWA